MKVPGARILQAPSGNVVCYATKSACFQENLHLVMLCDYGQNESFKATCSVTCKETQSTKQSYLKKMGIAL